jgi:transposase-like protein
MKITNKFYKAVDLYSENKYTTREIAEALNVEHSLIKEWIQTDYFLKIKRSRYKGPSVPVNRQEGFSSWIDAICISVLNRKLQQEKKKKTKKKLKRAS